MGAPLVFVQLAAIALSTIEENRERRRQEDYQREKERQERANALAAQRIAIAEIQAQQVADAESAAVETEANRRQAAGARGTAQVTAGEIGAFGQSFENLVSDFNRQQAEFEASVHTNLAIRRQFANLNLQSAALDAEARLNNARLPPIPKVNYANYLIQGVSAIGGYYNSPNR